MAMPRTTAPSIASAPNRPVWREPFVAWAFTGAVCVLGMLWVLGRWALGGNLHPVETGTYHVSSTRKAILRAFETLMIVGLAAGAAYYIRQYRALGKVTFEAALFIGCLTMGWLMPITNYRHQFYAGNKASINVTSWGPYFPGWTSDNPKHLIVGLFSGEGFALWVMMAWFWAGRWLLNRICDPQRTWSRTTLVLTAAAVSIVTEIILETLWLLSGSFVHAAAGIRGGYLYAGTRYQLPFGEILVMAAWPFALILLERFARDLGAEVVVLRGSDRIAPRARPWVRILAVSGLTNILMVGYSIGIMLLLSGTHLNPVLPSEFHP